MAEKYDPIKFEMDILDYWESHKIHKKANEKNSSKKKFYFCDGPPYTSGKVHLGTAWNKSLKDSLLRYKRMSGFDVWDRAGYDMHGLPTEQGVEKKLGLNSKDDIEKFGVANFINACEEFALNNLEVMNRDFKRLGVWMDFDNAYQTKANEWIEGEWWLIKKAHERERLYEGEKTMHWCSRCETALAKHELEYKTVTETSIFVKLKVRGTADEYLIVWTTTPWTIPFNLGVMVNPNIEYVRARVGSEIWIVAKALVDDVIVDKAQTGYIITDEMRGSSLAGLKYDHPLSDTIRNFAELEKKHPNVHTIVLSEEYVDLSAGSGLVHMAPGCGPEDYEVGYRNNIPPFNTLSESGVFQDMGALSGLKAKKDDKRFIEALEERGAIVAKSRIEHEYAHCWRCKEPIIFKTTKQWFFRIEDLKEKMRELNKGFAWVPDYAGSKNFDNWIANLRDNGITRQRYWGTPLPIWKCSVCGNYTVIGSLKELREKASNAVPENIHKPWIDSVTVNCSCGSLQSRIPDVLDVWIDSGSASWNCIYYPQRNDLFEKLYPMDFVLEGIDQIRGWFNMLYVASMVALERPCFNAVYMHGFINDSLGRKMSKSLGNYILPEEVVEKYGADTFRYYSIGGTKPGEDLNYNFEDMKVKNKNLLVLWNLHNYLIDLSTQLKVNPSEIVVTESSLGTEEKFILSKLNSAIRNITGHYDRFDIDKAPAESESLFLGLSRTYIQLIRDKVALGSDDEKRAVIYTIYNVLLGAIKVFSPVAPFITEKIYLDLKKEYGLREESISLFDWPAYDPRAIDKTLESQMEIISGIIQAILSSREKIQYGMRWPLSEALVITKDRATRDAVEELKELIKTQANVKKVMVGEKLEGVKTIVKADFGRLGPDFGKNSPKIIAELSKNSPESILKHIESHGKFEMALGSEKYNIIREHLIVQRVVPEDYVESASKDCFIYLNRKITPELEAEGFSREVMRRVQALRKTALLQKSDRIELFIKADKLTLEMLYGHKTLIKEKVGAAEIEISSSWPSKEHTHKSSENIKDRQIELMFNKVECLRKGC